MPSDCQMNGVLVPRSAGSKDCGILQSRRATLVRADFCETTWMAPMGNVTALITEPSSRGVQLHEPLVTQFSLVFRAPISYSYLHPCSHSHPYSHSHSCTLAP